MIGTITVDGDNTGNIASTGARIIKVDGTLIDLHTQWKRPNWPDRRRRPGAFQREGTVEQIHAKLLANERLALIGLSGSGKSTLASRYASRYNSVEEYPGGVLWVDLGFQFRDPLLCKPILDQWASWAYGGSLPVLQANVQVDFDSEVVAQLLTGHGPMLVVLDNLWHVAAAEPLLRACPPEAHVLVTTSRADVLEEFPRLSVGMFQPSEARALLTQALPDVPQSLLDELALALGYHPHALSVAIKGIGKGRSSAAQAERCRAVLARARAGMLPDQDAEAEQESAVTITLATTYEEIGETSEGAEQQRRLRYLGALGPIDDLTEIEFSTTMAAGLWGATLDESEVLLEELVARSLLTPSGEQRWVTHALVRNYSRTQLQRGGEWELAQAAYMSHVLDSIEQLLNVPPQQPLPDLTYIIDVAERVNTALGALTEAGEAANDAEPFERELNFVQALGSQSMVRPEIGELALASLPVGIAAAQALRRPEIEGSLRLFLAQITMAQGQPLVARELYLTNLTLGEAHEYPGMEAWSLLGLGVTYRLTGDNEQALGFYERALLLARALEDERLGCYCLNNLGELNTAIARFTQALDYLQQALPHAGALEDAFMEAGIELNITLLRVTLGDFRGALEILNQAEPRVERLGVKLLSLPFQNLKGLTLLEMGELERAEEHLNRSLQLSKDLGSRREQAIILNNLATLEQRRGNGDATLALLQEALDILSAINDQGSYARVLANTGQLLQLQGNAAQGLERLQQALPLLQAAHDRKTAVGAMYLIGKIYQEAERHAEGITYFEGLLPALQTVDHTPERAMALTWLGLLAQDSGYTVRALDLFEQVLPLLDELEDPVERATVLLTVLKVYATTGRIQQAIDLGEQMVALARECRLEQHEGEARVLLASFYIQVGQIDLADEHAGAVVLLARRLGNRPAHAFALVIQAAARLSMGATDEATALLSNAERESSGNPTLEAQVAYQMGLNYMMRNDFPHARERLETALKTIREHGFIEQEAITRLLLALIDYSTPERQQLGLQAMESAMAFVETHAARLEVAGLQTEVFRQYLEQMQAEQSGQGTQSVENLVALLLCTTDWSTFEMLVRANVARLQSMQLDELFAAALEEASDRGDEVARRILRAFRSFLGWCIEEGGVEVALRRARTSFESDYLYAWWGRVNRSNGAYYRALISLNRALELAPNSPQHMVERAWAYRGLGSYSRSLEDLRRAQELRPDDAETSLALAVLSYELGDTEVALQQIERASQHGLDPYGQQWRGSILLSQGDYVGALASLSQAVEQDRRNTEHYYWRALARLAAGDAQGATDDLDRLVELDYAEPAKQFYSLCWRGLAHSLAADEALAEDDWARSAQLAASLPANNQQQFALGLLAAMRRDLAAARSHYGQALRNQYTRHRLVTHVQHIRLLERLRRHQPGLAELARWLGDGSAHAAA